MNTAPIKRLGLFGGTFNPVHLGHLKVAREVEKRLALDKILFIPSYLPPHKASREIAPPEDRLEMVKLAVKPFPRFEASAVEIESSGPSYSIITVEKIKKLYPGAEVFFLVGIDAFLEIKTWKEYPKLLSSCSFVVVSRPGFSLRQAAKAVDLPWRTRLRRLNAKRFNPLAESGPLIFMLPIKAIDVSSTEVRRRIHQREPISRLVPPAVEKYIQRKNLYQDFP